MMRLTSVAKHLGRGRRPFVAVGMLGIAAGVAGASNPAQAQRESSFDRLNSLEARVVELESALYSVSFGELHKQDAASSQAIISYFTEGAPQAQRDVFNAYSKDVTKSILDRDAQDDVKLAAGIQIGIAKGAIPSDIKVEPVMAIDVLGKSVDEVSELMLAKLGDTSGSGRVVILQGLSGTGKGTTVAKLQEKLPNVVCWSNGNLFRSLTLLAVTYCEQHGIPFSPEIVTAERLREFMGMLTFGEFNGKYDIKIEGLGLKLYVSEVCNTLLKDKKVGANIPSVAELSQGEVVTFAAAAVTTLSAAGRNVIMEGRAQTLNYVRSPYRFELGLSDTNVIGQRRAAQLIMARTLQGLGSGDAEEGRDLSPELNAALAAISKD